MDTQSPISHLHDYMHKEHNIKLDVVNSQAHVPHIFRKTKVPCISDPFVNVCDHLIKDLESQTDVQHLIDNKLYEKYRFLFNNISKDALYYYYKQDKESHGTHIEDDTNDLEFNDSICNNRKRQKIDLNSYSKCRLDGGSNGNDTTLSGQWINILLSMSKFINSHTHNKDLNVEVTRDKLNTESAYSDDFSNSSNTELNLVDGSSLERDFTSTNNNDNDTTITNTDNSSTSTSTTKDPYNEVKDTNDKIDYKFIKKISTVLVGFVSHMDDWKLRVGDSLSRIHSDRLTLDQAKELLEEFREMSCGMITCDIADRLEAEIRKSEEYCLKVRQELSFVFEDSEEESSLDLSLAERFLKDGVNTTFVTQEYLTLSQVFHSISSLRDMLDQSVLEYNLFECDSLIKEIDSTIVKLPHLEKLRSFITRTFWFSNASKYSKTAVHYKLISELIENTPVELKDNELYHILKDKLDRTYQWIEMVNQSGLSLVVKNGSCKVVDNHTSTISNKNSNSKDNNNKEEQIKVEQMNRINIDSNINERRNPNINRDESIQSIEISETKVNLEGSENMDNKIDENANTTNDDNKDQNSNNSMNGSIDNNINSINNNTMNNTNTISNTSNNNKGNSKNKSKVKPKDIETMYNNYHQLEVLVPIYKSVEHVYIIWKRFQRRHRKFVNMRKLRNGTNFTMEAMVLLQQAEQVSEYMDISSILDPIIKDVEISLEFERKFRQIMVRFNNWSITNLCVKFNTDWNTLANFRKTASVSENDLVEAINIIYIYQNHTRDVMNKNNNNENKENNENNKEKKENIFNTSITRETAEMTIDEETKSSCSSTSFYSYSTTTTTTSTTSSNSSNEFEMNYNSSNTTGSSDSITNNSNSSNNSTSSYSYSNSNLNTNQESSSSSSYYNTTNTYNNTDSNSSSTNKTSTTSKDNINNSISTDSNSSYSSGSSSDSSCSSYSASASISPSSNLATSKQNDIDTRVEFSEIMELNGEFNSLKIKNWPIYRVLEEMCNTALHIKERAENVIKDINEGYRSEGLMSNLILVTLDSLKFGADLGIEDKLLKALKFCLWVKNLYSLFLKLYIIIKSRSRSNKVMGIDNNCININNNNNNNNINDQGIGKGESSIVELNECFPDEFDQIYQEFILFLRQLVGQAVAEDFQDMLDAKISIGCRLNISLPSSSNQPSNYPKYGTTIDGLRNVVDLNSVFTLTEQSLVATFTPS